MIWKGSKLTLAMPIGDADSAILCCVPQWWWAKGEMCEMLVGVGVSTGQGRSGDSLGNSQVNEATVKEEETRGLGIS